MDDYYCKICKAHMNSEDMWESHISGKRHLKNLKKEQEAPHPSRQEKDNEDFCNRSASSSSEVANSTHRKLYVRQRSRSPYSMDSSRRYCSPDSYSSYRKKAYTSPPDGKWRHDRFYLHEQSPPPPSRQSSHSSHSKDELQQLLGKELSGSDKIDMMKKMSKTLIVLSENEAEKVKSVITSLYDEYILARVKVLSRSTQNKSKSTY